MEIIDLEDRRHSNEKRETSLNVIDIGFRAITMDYSYYVENTFGLEHKIYELHENMVYRFFSSNFHIQLLYRQQEIIEHRLNEIYKKFPDTLIQYVRPKNPYYLHAEKEMSSLLDSIIFHLSSIYDYLSVLINYLCLKDKDQKPKWSQLCSFAKNKEELSSKDIARTILDINLYFVDPLYSYRSKIIHRDSDINEHSVEIYPIQNKVDIKFCCSEKLMRAFKKFGGSDNLFTLIYFADWISTETINSIAKLLFALKKEIQDDNKLYSNLIKMQKESSARPFIIGTDANNNMIAPSTGHWRNFENYFKEIL